MLRDLRSGGLLQGRQLEVFRHRTGLECGYENDQEDTFCVLHPGNEQKGMVYPLVVVFHSAGHDCYSAVGCNYYPGNHDLYHVPEQMFGLFLDCREHFERDWWWGGQNAWGQGPETFRGIEPQPVERRCIMTLQWVLDNYPVDRFRVYGVGLSMGGSGALGVGLCRGDLFAALKVGVAAGVRHAADRCCLEGTKPEGFSIPDPPVVVDYSAQNDRWSDGHEVLYRGMRERRYALYGFWGMFGHEGNHGRIAEFNDLVDAFDLWSVRSDRAYPVFTEASTDDPIPWPDNLASEAPGQVNGFFRWENGEDTEQSFSISLRLLSQEEWKTRISLPRSSTANVTLRRLQRFRLAPGERFFFSFGDRTGTSFANAEGKPEVQGLTLTDAPQMLTLRKIK